MKKSIEIAEGVGKMKFKEVTHVVLAHISGGVGKIVAISRRDNPEDFGFIGGKVDPGENLFTALRREVLEETGIEVLKADKVNTSFYRGNMVHTYNVTECNSLQHYLTHDNQGEGIIKIVSPETLMKGSYGDFNKMLIEQIYGKQG